MSKNKIIFFCIVVAYFLVILFTRTPDFFSGRITKGKVVRIEQKSVPGKYGRMRIINVPDVEFMVNGQTYTFMDYYAMWPPIYEVGDSVRVIYDPRNPRNCYMFSFIGYWINITELMIAAFAVVIPLAIYNALRKPKTLP